MTEVMDVITLDDGSDNESVSSSSSRSNSATNSTLRRINFGSSSGATVSITNERPLDLSQFLPYSAVPKPMSPSPPPQAAKINPSPQPPVQATKNHLPSKVNAPFMARPTYVPKNGNLKIVGAVNGANGVSSKPLSYISTNNHVSSVLFDVNRKRSSLEPRDKPSTDKRPRISIPTQQNRQQKNEIHGNVTYIASEPNQGFTAQDGEEFSGQFRCTSYNCNKVLPNNVSFMYHLWAHVGFFAHREYTMDIEQMSDEKFTRMCSVCLMICETAFERTRHYLEVHRSSLPLSNFCHMCEIVDHDGKHGSHIKHRQNELPYECRRCKYRASSRMALIDHFAKIHVGTTALMCPFCPYTTQISVSEKQKPIVLAKNYVQHVCDHGNVIAKKCSCCSYKFIEDNCFEKHTKCHQSEQHKHPMLIKSFRTLKEDALKTKPRHEMLTLMKCVECNTQFPKAEDHFDTTRKCNNCSFESSCLVAYWNHIYLSDCDPENKERFSFSVGKSGKFEKPKCSWKYKNNLKVYKSPQFIQSFRLFRDFAFDRKPSNLPLPPPKSDEELLKEHRERLKSIITVRKINEIPSNILDEICQSIFGDQGEDTSTIKLVKELRRPQVPFFQDFLAQLKQKEDEEGDEDSMSIITPTSTADTPASAPAISAAS